MAGWTSDDIPSQEGRTVVVTGANSGLGLRSSVALAARGARVLMACRDAGRAQAALATVRGEVPGALAEVVPLDLSSLASVESAAADIASRVAAVDVLINNAGVMAIPRMTTADGFEMQLGTNHLGHFALTGRLLPLLRESPSPRVVSVSSAAHRIGRMHFDDLMGERHYQRWAAYGQSKLANLLFIAELGRRHGSWLLAAAAHPGYASTHLQKGQSSPLLEQLMRIGNHVLAQSDTMGAWPQLYAATMPDVRPGDYLGPSVLELRGHPKRVGRSARAKDAAAAGTLWDRSAELTGVSY